MQLVQTSRATRRMELLKLVTAYGARNTQTETNVLGTELLFLVYIVWF